MAKRSSHVAHADSFSEAILGELRLEIFSFFVISIMPNGMLCQQKHRQYVKSVNIHHSQE